MDKLITLNLTEEEAQELFYILDAVRPSYPPTSDTRVAILNIILKLNKAKGEPQ